MDSKQIDNEVYIYPGVTDYASTYQLFRERFSPEPKHYILWQLGHCWVDLTLAHNEVESTRSNEPVDLT